MCWNTYFCSVFWISTKICPKHGPNLITFTFCKTQVIKNVLLQPSWSKKWYFCLSWKIKHWTKHRWNHCFYSALAELKKRFFKFQFKTGNFEKKNTVMAPNFWENAIFRKLPDNWPKKHKMIIECAKIAWNHFQNRPKTNLAQIMTSTWPR